MCKIIPILPLKKMELKTFTTYNQQPKVDPSPDKLVDSDVQYLFSKFNTDRCHELPNFSRRFTKDDAWFT